MDLILLHKHTEDIEGLKQPLLLFILVIDTTNHTYLKPRDLKMIFGVNKFETYCTPQDLVFNYFSKQI